MVTLIKSFNRDSYILICLFWVWLRTRSTNLIIVCFPNCGRCSSVPNSSQNRSRYSIISTILVHIRSRKSQTRNRILTCLIPVKYRSIIMCSRYSDDIFNFIIIVYRHILVISCYSWCIRNRSWLSTSVTSTTTSWNS